MSDRYTATAKTLHWLIAIMILTMLGLGFYMHDLPLSPEKLKLYSWHKWAGVTIFLLVIMRLAWRLTHQPPPMPSSIPRLQQWLAHSVHVLLYLLMFAIPLSGWLMSSAKGFQVVWFGVLPLPNLIDKNKALGDLLLTVHLSLNLLLITLLLGHVGAALKHHFIDKDTVLKRMLPTLTAPSDDSI
ncbi:cytochrome b [uncultured Thiodictyon sp.]|uniref:cytochrome b n=1 Tax=uncultured Thiodictyon sp. TaxID=1846217 RepID=UPI0025D6BA8D|nr:cytochrome b [uncultured Thiodictyon sp.]